MKLRPWMVKVAVGLGVICGGVPWWFDECFPRWVFWAAMFEGIAVLGIGLGESKGLRD